MNSLMSLHSLQVIHITLSYVLWDNASYREAKHFWNDRFIHWLELAKKGI